MAITLQKGSAWYTTVEFFTSPNKNGKIKKQYKIKIRSNLGYVLNLLAADGWVLDNDVVIPRHPLYSSVTRHKLHLIMKKEYKEGDNPFLRLEEKAELPPIYEGFGRAYKALDTWSAYLITSWEDTEKYVGRKADKNRKIYNGMLKTNYYQFIGPKPPKMKKEE